MPNIMFIIIIVSYIFVVFYRKRVPARQSTKRTKIDSSIPSKGKLKADLISSSKLIAPKCSNINSSSQSKPTAALISSSKLIK